MKAVEEEDDDQLLGATAASTLNLISREEVQNKSDPGSVLNQLINAVDSHVK